MDTIKHGGCKDCGDRTEPVLTSIPDNSGKGGAFSKCVCSKCLRKQRPDLVG